MTLQDKIRADMVIAMKAKDETRLSVLRGLLTMFMQELTSTKRTPQDTLTDEEVLAVIRRAQKQRKDAAEQFRAGGRPELAQAEEAEELILAEYLPSLMSAEDIEALVRAKATALGVSDKSSMGKLIGAVMAECKGRADGGVVKAMVEKTLDTTK